MRVIAGRLRSRQLQAPVGGKTRPTSDRLRETLFNVLGPRVDGARVADLYAGTGAVGIEAMSRGAAFVVFAEKAAGAAKVLRENLRALGLTTGFAVEERSVLAVLERRKGTEAAFDVVFLDPPYELVDEYAGAMGWLGGVSGAAWLSEGGWVVVEHATRSPLLERYGALARFRVLRQGDASLSFYARVAAATE